MPRLPIPFPIFFLTWLVFQSQAHGPGVPVGARLRLGSMDSQTTRKFGSDRAHGGADREDTAAFLNDSGLTRQTPCATFPHFIARNAGPSGPVPFRVTCGLCLVSSRGEAQNQAQRLPSTPADTKAIASSRRDFSLRLQRVDASNSRPYTGVDVLLRTRDQSWQQRVDSEGQVSFPSIPCDGTVSLKLLEGEQPFRTVAFPCQPTAPLSLSAFVVQSCRSRLQLMTKPANPTRLGPGIITQRIRFKRCAAATTIQGAFVQGGIHNYLLTARQGQEMSIHVVPGEEDHPVLFDVYWGRNPSLYIPTLSAKAGCIANENVRDFKGVLPESGEYVVSVYTDGGSGHYFLDIIIQ
jgi:hypothetical protein